MKTTKIKSITTLSILIALAAVLSLFDNYISLGLKVVIPFLQMIPSFKLGIANIVIMIIIYNYSFIVGLQSVIIKSVLVGLMFAGAIAFIIGFPASLGSFLIMYLFKKSLNDRKYIPFISILGGVAHGFIQVVAATVYYGFDNSLMSFVYLPIILLIGVISGYLIGLLAQKIMKTTNKFISSPNQTDTRM